MSTAIRTDTRGRVETQVFAQNNNSPGSDPAALKMLVAGEIQFFTLLKTVPYRCASIGALRVG